MQNEMYGQCGMCGGLLSTGHICNEFNINKMGFSTEKITGLPQRVVCNIDANPGKTPGDQLTPAEIRTQISNWIAGLVAAERMGALNDSPEGSRYIMISDTLAQTFVSVLRALHSLHSLHGTVEE